MDFVYDIETYPNVFTVAFEAIDSELKLCFEISQRKDESKEIVHFLKALISSRSKLIGFNNVGFDYPVLHMLIMSPGCGVQSLYQKAQSIINSSGEENSRWLHLVHKDDVLIPQLDLYKIHHFDNRAKATSLKSLQFNMRSDSIEDLPFPVGSLLSNNEIDILKRYNQHDVAETKKFYWLSKEMIDFREELSRTYNHDFTNFNDAKIGRYYFESQLEKAGVPCYTFDGKRRAPRQTPRTSIKLSEAILPWIKFKNSEFQRVSEWFKRQIITETKGVFTDVSATVNGFTFVFGLGGIHGSVESQVVSATETKAICDLDVTSFYPNLAISHGFYPEHLTSKFGEIYRGLFEQRMAQKKGSARYAMLKLALNSTFGDSNNPYSPFYDPLFTMSITLNGQLLLCLLAEMLMEIPTLSIIQANTDGLTYSCGRQHIEKTKSVVKEWEQITNLKIEINLYEKMWIRDVNNYIALYTDDKVKRKGAYEYNTQWHQDASALVVPKVAEKVLLESLPIRKTVEEWPDIMDFMMRVKAPRGSHLSIEYPGENPQKIQNITRYYVSKEGPSMVKWMPPLKGKTEWRRIGVQAGRRVAVCNDLLLSDRPPVDFDYYINEVEKLCLILK